MATTKINVCVDENTKQAVEALLDDMGLTMTAAINIYLKRILMEQGIPFEVSARTPNATTIAAMEEYEEMKKHPEKYPKYNNASEMFAAILGGAE